MERDIHIRCQNNQNIIKTTAIRELFSMIVWGKDQYHYTQVKPYKQNDVTTVSVVILRAWQVTCISLHPLI